MSQPPRTAYFAIRRTLLFVLALSPLVQCTGRALAAGERKRRGSNEPSAPQAAARSPSREAVIGRDPRQLPPAVADMRSAILAAVESGDMADLRVAIELNEMKPDFGAPPGSDPIAVLKAQSGDGAGLEMLAILGRLLDGAWAAIPGGRDIENNRIYVWPHFAEIPLAQLTPAEEVALYRLVPPAEAKVMRETGRWTWWRLTIGADGVWHGFTRVR
jgi:hypothetical protein